MKLTEKRLVVWLVCLFCAGCASRQDSDQNMLEIKSDHNTISFFWGGAERLAGGVPALSGVEFRPVEMKQRAKEEGMRFSFVNPAGRAVEVRTRLFPKRAVVAVYLSPKGNQSRKGEDFVGLTWEDFPGYQRGTAFYRYGPVKAWTIPVGVATPGDLKHEEDVQFFLWQYSDSTYGGVMPLGGEGYNATLGTHNGHFGIKSRCLVDNAEAENIPLAAFSFGRDPYQLIDQLYTAGMEVMDRKDNLRKYKRFPSVLEHIGWCTWNAYGHGVNQEKILAGVSTFTRRKFPLPFLLIDDGWLHITGPNGQLKTFTPDPKKFPKGLRPVVERLQNEHGVKHVGVWHTMNAYWGGVDIKGTLGKQYKNILMAYRDKVTWTDKPVQTFYAPTARSKDGFRFFDDWYGYLKKEGISFVKVDNQLVIDRMARHNHPLWETGAYMQGNLHRAIDKHFDGAVINCMDMTTNALYHYGTSSVARSSEDFFPDNQTYHMEHGNAAVHVLCNLYNALWLSPMVWPDFDMFQSHHPDGAYHAIARAISGGPIYFTDTPGRQKFDVIWPLIYRDGRIIRADVPARPTEDCLFQIQEARPFKAFSFSGKAGLLGVWNAADADRVEGSFRPADVHGIEGEKFVVYEYFSRRLRVADRNQTLPLSLGRMGHQLYMIIPLEDNAAPIGLVNKYNAPKTIQSATVTGSMLEATLPEGGVFGAYLAEEPTEVEVDGRKIGTTEYTWKDQLLEVKIGDSTSKNEHTIRVRY